MKKDYIISGMSSNSCRIKVEDVLNQIIGVQATVTFDPPTATIISEQSLTIFKLQKKIVSSW